MRSKQSLENHFQKMEQNLENLKNLDLINQSKHSRLLIRPMTKKSMGILRDKPTNHFKMDKKQFFGRFLFI